MYSGSVPKGWQGVCESWQADRPRIDQQKEAKKEMMDGLSLVELAQVGTGLAIAIIVLLWKRADDQKYQARLCEVQEQMSKLTDRFIAAIEANTSAFQTVATALNVIEKIEDLRDEFQKRSRTQ